MIKSNNKSITVANKTDSSHTFWKVINKVVPKKSQAKLTITSTVPRVISYLFL